MKRADVQIYSVRFEDGTEILVPSDLTATAEQVAKEAWGNSKTVVSVTPKGHYIINARTRPCGFGQ